MVWQQIHFQTSLRRCDEETAMSKSEHDKCRISCSVCLYRFSSPSPDMLAITPSGGRSSLGWSWALGMGWWQILTAQASPSTAPHGLICFSAQHWDGSVILPDFCANWDVKSKASHFFHPTRWGKIYLCSILLGKLAKVLLKHFWQVSI